MSEPKVALIVGAAIHQQPRSAWTFEADVRPWLESW